MSENSKLLLLLYPPVRSLQETNQELGEEVAVLKKKMDEFEAKVSRYTPLNG